MRDTGSTTCVVKKSLVKPEQMTGSYELYMLIDGIVKRYPTAMVELDTPYFSGRTKVLCMDNPVQNIIIGNIPGGSGVHPNLVNTKATPDKVGSTQSLTLEYPKLFQNQSPRVRYVSAQTLPQIPGVSEQTN